MASSSSSTSSSSTRTVKTIAKGQELVRGEVDGEWFVVYFVGQATRLACACTNVRRSLWEGGAELVFRNDKQSGRTRMLNVPLMALPKSGATEASSSSGAMGNGAKAPLPRIHSWHYDEEVHALSVFFIAEERVRDLKTRTIMTADERFIFDVHINDEGVVEIVHFEVPDVRTSLQVQWDEDWVISGVRRC